MINCICGNCDNKLSVTLSEENAEILIFEETGYRGSRKSIVVSRELGVLVLDAIASFAPLPPGVCLYCKGKGKELANKTLVRCRFCRGKESDATV